MRLRTCTTFFEPSTVTSFGSSLSTNGMPAIRPQIPQSIWYTTEVYCPGFRVVRPLKPPTAEESKDFEPEYEPMKEYKEAQAGKT